MPFAPPPVSVSNDCVGTAHMIEDSPLTRTMNHGEQIDLRRLYVVNFGRIHLTKRLHREHTIQYAALET